MADYQIPEGFEEIQGGVASGIPEGYELVEPARTPFPTKPVLSAEGQPELDVPGITNALGQGQIGGALVDVAGGAYEGMRRSTELLDDATLGQVGLDPRPEDQPLGVPASPMASEGVFETSATLAPTIAGGLAAGGLAKNLPGIVRWIATNAGASIGYASSVNPAQDNLLFGEGGLFEGLPEKDEEGKQNRLNTFLNDAVDAMALAYPAEAAGKLVGKAASFLNSTVFKPAFRWVTGNVVKGAEDVVAEQFIKLAGLARNAKTPQEKQLILEQMAQKMLEHEKIVFKFGDEDEAILRDTVSALEESLKGSVGVPDAETIMQKARSLRQGALQTGAKGGDLATKLSEPSVQTERILTEEEARRGGQASIDVAGEGVQEQAVTKFQKGAEGESLAKGAEIDVAEQDLGTLFKNDPALKKQLDALDDNVKLDVLEARNQTRDEIVENTQKAYDEMETELGKLADEIPEGQIVDFDVDEIAELDPDLLKKYQKKGYLNFSVDEGAITEVTGDFKQLYKKVVPELNKAINQKLKAGGDASSLMAFRQLIRDKVEEVPEAGKLRDYYKNTWAPLWKDGKLEQFKNLQYKKNSQPVNAAVETERTVEGALTENPRFTEHLNKIAGNEPLSTDWYLQNAAADIQKQINRGETLGSMKFDSILGPLEQYGATLQKTSPEQAKRVTDFLTKVRDQKGSIKTLNEELKTLVKARDEAERTIFQQEYKDFFDKSNLAKKGNQYSNFDSLLKKNDSGNVIQEILDTAKAEGREDIVKGVQSAYLRYVKEEIFSDSAKVVSSGGKAFKTSFINDVLSGKNNTLSYGRQIFKDEPIAIDFLESMLKEGKRIQDSVGNVGQIAPADYTQFKGETSAALDRIVTWTFGVLNKTAARVRSLKGAAMQNYTEPSEVLASVVDRFYTDPQYAADLIKRVAQAETKGRTSPEFRTAFRDWILFQVKDSNADIHDVAQFEADIKSTLDSVSSQTDELLSPKKK